MTQPNDVAALLKGLRGVFRDHMAATGRHVGHPPLVAAEALLWIAGGIDHGSDLAEAMGMDRSTANRTIALLRGRTRWREGRSMSSPFGLIELRKHPHRRGYQLALTSDGRDLIASTFAPQMARMCTSDENPPCALS
jgi:DNA-binding MarR family transcriptional regulator